MASETSGADASRRTPPIRLLVDEDFDNDILRGVLRRRPDADVVRVQDVGLSGKPDPDVLEWAARQDRVLITHDVSTMKSHAYARVAASLPMPGVFALAKRCRSEPPSRRCFW